MTQKPHRIFPPKTPAAVLRRLLRPLLCALLLSAVASADDDFRERSPQSATPTLTQAEKTWIAQHRTIRIAGPKAFPPFHYYGGDAVPKGMSSDYVRDIFEFLGLETEVVNNLPWPEVLEKAKNKEIDLIVCAAKSPEREGYLLFSEPYLSFPMVIIGRKDTAFIGGLDDLHGKTVASVPGISTRDWLKQDGIDVKTLSVDSPLDALKAVSLNRADAAIENLAAATYLIEHHGLANLKIAAPTRYGNYNLYFAARNDWPELISVVNKALRRMPPRRHTEIRERWLNIPFEYGYGISKQDILKWLAIIGSAVALILMFTLFWNNRLQKEIREREAIEAELKRNLCFLKKMDRLDRVIREGTDLEKLMRETLDMVLQLFDCDRAWLFYPCDPDAPYWEVPMETARKEYPGAFAMGEPIAMTEAIRDRIRAILAAEGPIAFDSENLTDASEKRFAIRSQLVMAIYPKTGSPWIFGIHQCSHERIWNAEEKRLFREIGYRLTEALSSLLFLKNLMESEARYRYLLENINEVIFTADPDGRLTYAGPTLETLLGYSAAETAGISFFDFVDLADRAKVAGGFGRAAGGDAFACECRCRRKSGESIWIFISLRPMIKENRAVGVQGMLTDIDARKKAETERLALEARLARSRKMEALGLLAGGVAHDLNNILSGIVSYPDLMLMNLPEGSPLRKPIRTIRNTGQKAAAIVEDLLTLARRGVSRLEVLNLNAIIRDYLKSPEHERLMSFHPLVRLETRFEKSLMNLEGSPVHLKKTVMNLIANAAEALPDGGAILIATENRYLDLPVKGYDSVEAGEYVVLTVQDTGIGIADEDLSRIFEPFYTRKMMDRSGTGLGMAVVWGTVQDHHGYIGVESEIGKGTAFELYFPITREQELEARTPLSEAEYSGNGEAILVVDDVAQQREIACEILTRLGYRPHSVPGGEAAVEYLQTHAADLVILDMIMDPGMDGLDTYKRILETHPEQRAVIASGFAETARVREAQALGAGEYVKKPYTIEKIGVAVRNALDNGRAGG